MGNEFGLAPLEANQVSMGLRDHDAHYRLIKGFSVDNIKDVLQNYLAGKTDGLLYHEVIQVIISITCENIIIDCFSKYYNSPLWLAGKTS
jgi:hypothetical protein